MFSELGAHWRAYTAALAVAVVLIVGLMALRNSAQPAPAASAIAATTPAATATPIVTAAHESKPSAAPSKKPEPDATESSEPDAEQVLTADKSKEFAALLAVRDNCDETIGPFVAKYGGRTIEFDGSIASMANHGDYDTRYDILVAPGNKGPESAVGPAFKFEDVNVFDLNLTGAKIPDSVGEGDRFRFVAQVLEYNPDQCLFLLAPVSTSVR